MNEYEKLLTEVLETNQLKEVDDWDECPLCRATYWDKEPYCVNQSCLSVRIREALFSSEKH